MARPREFDEAEVLDKAMMCFWQKGYENASVSALEKATGISRISLYNSFKDKENLFIAIQQRYHHMAEAFFDQVLDEKAGMEELERFFLMLSSKDLNLALPRQYGCMMVNTVLSLDSVSQKIIDNVKDYSDMVIGKLRDFLYRMQSQGNIDSEINIEDAAPYLYACICGAQVTNRLYGDPVHSQQQVNMFIRTIRSWRK